MSRIRRVRLLRNQLAKKVKQNSNHNLGDNAGTLFLVEYLVAVGIYNSFASADF